jgi:hypothetical protein
MSELTEAYQYSRVGRNGLLLELITRLDSSNRDSSVIDYLDTQSYCNTVL